MHSGLNWDDLRLVLAVAREGTLSGAGRTLGVTHSTVSAPRRDRAENGRAPVRWVCSHALR
jgi:Bacterial regulatory helix-turn-helix protein, lysR family